MLAYVLHRYGGADGIDLREVPAPTPGPGEVLIQVRAAGLNPIDFKTRDGKLRPILRYRLPQILGGEVAGVVAACGAGVDRLREGDRVFARLDKRRLGGFAEQVACRQELIARVPDGLDLVPAAGLPLAGLTALQALRDQLHAGPGVRLFVPGGAGGVGTLAIQIAKALGAEVITTASPRGEALVRRLGADEVIDYTRERFEDRVSGVDGALDLVGGDTLARAFAVVKRGGLVVSIAGVPEPTTAREDMQAGLGLQALFWAASFGLRAKARRHGVRYRYLFMRPDGDDLAELARMNEAGALEVVVDRVLPFAEIAAAMAHLESGRAKGKVIVRMGEA
ncbi:MAG: NADP-dependent oxidoreductase [Nannocystaceae bacterium]